MSRFVELIERTDALDLAGFRSLAFEMLARLGAKSGAIEMRSASMPSWQATWK